MGALAIIILFLIGAVIYFHLKQTVMTGIVTFFAALFALIVAFGYYEVLASIMADKGYAGGNVFCLTFLVLYFLTFIIIQVSASFIVGSDIEFGELNKKIVTIVLGLATGFIFSSVVIMALNFYPLIGFLSYSRYDTSSNFNINSPKSLMLSADGITSGLFSWISQGSLSGNKSFAVYRADYLDQIHLATRFEGVFASSGQDCLIVPKKIGARNLQVGDKMYTVVRVGLKNKPVKEGGAKGKDGSLNFVLPNFRLVCKQGPDTSTTGTARAFYPAGLVEKGKLVEKPSNEIITVSSEMIKRKPHGNAAWFDIAFDLPSSMNPVMMQFKLFGVSEVPKVVDSTDEIELSLEKEQKTDTDNTAGGS